MSRTIALLLGDRTGVGPELVAKLSTSFRPPSGVLLQVMGDPVVWEAACAVAKASPSLSGAWAFEPRPTDARATLGQVSSEAGQEVLDTLADAAQAARKGTIDGIVYAPLNKQSMKLAGHAAGDELDFFNHHLPGGGATGEINILGDLWTSRVTSHVPLREVGDLITRENVLRGVDLLATALRRSGRANPRLAVAALNPHAGEGGAFGHEEIDVIAPAVAEAREKGLDVEGPFPSDTIFPRAVNGAFDGVVTMFHDQGQIALKMVGLGRGITLLAGFPVPIATPGHGTAHDIAGKGIARADGLEAAVSLVVRMTGEET